jgi:hypothetical protein
MDQEAFRETYQQINERYCVYEKAILTHQCACSQSEKLHIAEREATHCRSDACQAQCILFLDTLKNHARFALKLTGIMGVLPHGKAIKIQVGGLRGLQQVLNPDQDADFPIDDVAGLIAQAVECYQNLDKLPFSTIMQQVAAYKGRKRISKRT